MKKNIYKLNNIDCAACALKIENDISKLEGVYSSNLNFMLLKFYVSFDENIISENIIELEIHKSLKGVEIIEKNNKPYEDNYKEDVKTFKKIIFGRKNKK